MNDREADICTEQCNIRLTVDEKVELERRAKQAGVPPGTFARRQVLGAIRPVGDERRGLIVVAMAGEISRLTFIAAQNGAELGTEESKERIEREARLSSEALVDRWLNLNQPKGVA